MFMFNKYKINDSNYDYFILEIFFIHKKIII